MVESTTMVLSNKKLSWRTQLPKTQWHEKGIEKGNSQVTILLTLSKLSRIHIQSNIKI